MIERSKSKIKHKKEKVENTGYCSGNKGNKKEGDGEGNGTPLQYSCLENPKDRGAWWASVSGVAQSWTRLKQLSSSSSKYTINCYFVNEIYPIEPIYGEGNGNPLQCSCLENPRDGGAWWASVSGVAQSRTRLKRLSSSSSQIKSDTVSTVSPSISHEVMGPDAMILFF